MAAMDWEPTAALRIVRSHRDDTRSVLQQEWRRFMISEQWGHVIGAESEWRPVEIVYEMPDGAIMTQEEALSRQTPA